MKHNRIHHWIWFSLILTSLPLLFTFWKLRGMDAPIPTENFQTSITANHRLSNYAILQLVISKGELLLVCLSLLGVNLGDLFKDPCINRNVGLVLIGTTIFLSLFSIYSFSEINTNSHLNQDFGCTTSIMTFLCTITICAFSNFVQRN